MENTNEENQSAPKRISIRILKCIETAFQSKPSIIANCKIEEVNFRFAYGFKKLEKDHVVVEINVRYNIGNEDIVFHKSEHHYHIDDMDQYLIFEDEKISDSANIVTTLLGMSYGSMRGLLASHTMGTRLEDFPAPIINPTEIADNNRYVEL